MFSSGRHPSGVGSEHAVPRNVAAPADMSECRHDGRWRRCVEACEAADRLGFKVLERATTKGHGTGLGDRLLHRRAQLYQTRGQFRVLVRLKLLIQPTPEQG